jgi:hypothetical protein
VGLLGSGCGSPAKGSGDAGADGGNDAGVEDGLDGGVFPSLYFAIVGDTRPLNADDLANYPTPIIQKIYADIEAMSPRPSFLISTGDYMNANSTAGQQLDLYLSASAQFTGGPIFPVMGNHECTGATDSNCVGTFSTNNFRQFQTKLLTLGQPGPYYRVNFSAQDGSWTAKLLVVACNAWDATQKAWLQAELGAPSTYTFVARHEELGAPSSPPCITDSDPIIEQGPYNILIVGHSHYFQYIGFRKEVVVGNGGAPLDSTSATFGYATVQQTASGFLVNSYDYQTAASLQSFTIPF